MAGREVRNFAEGSIRWVQASGTGIAWGTASAPATALIGYVQAGMAVKQSQTMETIAERGLPNHHKFVSKQPPEVTLTFLNAVSANWPPTAVTAAGASVPQVHFEIRKDVRELGGPTAEYWQLINCVFLNQDFGEAENGDTIAQTWRAMYVLGPTASGYLSTGGQ